MLDRYKNIFISFFLGFLSLIVQVICFREFLGTLDGNELITSLILGNWLFLVGVGSVLSAKFKVKIKNVIRNFQIYISIFPVAQLIFIRLIKAQVFQFADIGLGSAYFLILITLAPYCISIGTLLGLLTRVEQETSEGQDKKDSKAFINIYLADSLGSVFGGIAFYFFIADRLESIYVMCAISTTHILIMLLSGERKAIKYIMAMSAVIVTLSIVFSIEFKKHENMLVTGTSETAKVTNVLSPYGLFREVDDNKNRYFYENEVLVGTTVESRFIEESVHIPMSQHPEYKNVLLIFGGLSKAIDELKKYQDVSITYLERSKEIAHRIQKEKKKNLRVIVGDPRESIKGLREKFDVIISFAGDPINANINRYFTEEFFVLAKNVLRDDGIMTFSLGSSENVVENSMIEMGATVYSSARTAFKHLLVLPGSKLIFLASDFSLSLKIKDLIKEKGIQTKFLDERYLETQFSEVRINLMRNNFERSLIKNSDFRPTAYFFYVKKWLNLHESNLLLFMVFLILLILIVVRLVFKSEQTALSTTLLTTGFVNLGFEVVILMSYQIIYGDLFKKIGVLLSLFIAGFIPGLYLQSKREKKRKEEIIICDIILSLMMVSYVLMLNYIEANQKYLAYSSQEGVFYGFALIIGAIVGYQVSSIFERMKERNQDRVSRIYALDFLGASVGAVLTGIYLIPLVGLINTCYFFAVIKIISALYLYFREKEDKKETNEQIRSVGKEYLFQLKLALFFIAMLLIIASDTKTVVYQITTTQWFEMFVVLLVTCGFVFAIKPSLFKNAQIKWIYFIGMLPLAAFPLGRCYFKVPFFFCHVCPRPCLFGVVRFYLIPSIILMNLKSKFWCHNLCPIGRVQEIKCVTNTNVRMMRLLQSLWRCFGIVVLTIIVYFAVYHSSWNSITENDQNSFYYFLFNNAFEFSLYIVVIVILFVALSKFIKKPFCNSLCPVGALSDLILHEEKKHLEDEHEKELGIAT